MQAVEAQDGTPIWVMDREALEVNPGDLYKDEEAGMEKEPLKITISPIVHIAWTMPEGTPRYRSFDAAAQAEVERVFQQMKRRSEGATVLAVDSPDDHVFESEGVMFWVSRAFFLDLDLIEVCAVGEKGTSAFLLLHRSVSERFERRVTRVRVEAEPQKIPPAVVSDAARLLGQGEWQRVGRAVLLPVAGDIWRTLAVAVVAEGGSIPLEGGDANTCAVCMTDLRDDSLPSFPFEGGGRYTAMSLGTCDRPHWLCVGCCMESLARKVSCCLCRATPLVHPGRRWGGGGSA